MLHYTKKYQRERIVDKKKYISQNKLKTNVLKNIRVNV